jgi:3-dehydroquinate synthase
MTIICTDILKSLDEAIGNHSSDDIFILCDSNTVKLCLPHLLQSDKLKSAKMLAIPAGDENKTIATASIVWEFLSNNGATRKSLMINVGGGMITDIGGFCAATFKRGIDYINVSTTLLGAVDAATGGKTGVNFSGFKNEIGAFAPARNVLIAIEFFRTLDHANIISGYAEMLKHALISTKEEWNETLKFNLENIDFLQLAVLVERNINIKEDVVARDPKEQNIRKALNLGHTFGHAFESLSYKIGKPVLHGYAVIWGLLCELYLSNIKLNFPKEEIIQLKNLIQQHYGWFAFDCAHYELLLEYMRHDKKNESKDINFTLLSDVGEVVINQTATQDEIFECLDFIGTMQ